MNVEANHTKMIELTADNFEKGSHADGYSGGRHHLNLKGTMIPRIIIGILVGGGLGFGWYKLVGCSTGTCPLTSIPVISTIYDALFGGLLPPAFVELNQEIRNL